MCTLILFPDFEIIPRLPFQITITRTFRGCKSHLTLGVSYCAVPEASSTGGEHFLLVLQLLLLWKDRHASREKGKLSISLALVFWSPMPVSLIYAALCLIVLNSNITLNFCRKKLKRKFSEFNWGFQISLSVQGGNCFSGFQILMAVIGSIHWGTGCLLTTIVMCGTAKLQ